MRKPKSFCIAVEFLLLPIFLSAYVGAAGKVDIAEFGIRSAVIDYYIKGLQTRDFNLIRAICLPEAELMSAGTDGKLHVTTLERWSRRFDPNNPPFQSLDYTILKIDREGTAAQVKILFIKDGKQRITDYLHMLDLDGRWRIAHIIDF